MSERRDRAQLELFDQFRCGICNKACTSPFCARCLDLIREWSRDGTTEVWTAVPEYRGTYEVSSFGRVRSLDRVVVQKNGRRRQVTGRVMKMPSADQHGYPTIGLSRLGSLRSLRIHRLVLEAFHGSRPPGLVTRHLNDQPTDNRLCNLAWGTYSENNHDAVRNGRNWQTAKTSCARGHAYDEANTQWTTDTKGRRRRTCRTCRCDHRRRKRFAAAFRFVCSRCSEPRRQREEQA